MACSSAAWTWEPTRFTHAAPDPKRAERLKQTVQRLIAAQEASGYLGTFEPGNKARFDVDFANPGSWDVWVHRYNLYGLLTYERYHPGPAILTACERMADDLISIFGEGKEALTRNGISSSTLLESVMMLHARTGEARYLDFAKHVAACGEANPGLRLMGAMRDGEDVSVPGDGKACQLMANLLGYLRLYQATGGQEYLDTVLRGQSEIHDGHLLITGGPWSRHMPCNGNRECFARAEDFSPAESCVETCCTTTWIQLNLALFEQTGGAAYAAEAERAVFNHLIAAK